MSQAAVITLDGPSGTGKSTIAKLVAEALGFLYLDSGALYRALAWVVLQQSIDVNNKDALQRCINAAEVELADDGRVLCDGVDVSQAIRHEDVGMLASKISANPLVRKRLLQLQHDQRRAPGLVTDGRDMGTVVFPDAEVKFYLTASADERAKRRFNQLKEKGNSGSLREIEEELNIRDRQDSERSVSPLKPAADAVEIDTSQLDVQRVFDQVMKVTRSRL